MHAASPAGAADVPMQVRLAGRVLLLRVSHDASADAVARLAAVACRAAPSELAVFCRGRRLDGTATLLQSGVRSGASLRIGYRLDGGGCAPSSVKGEGEDTLDARPPHRPVAREARVGEPAMRRWKKHGGAELEAAIETGAIALLNAQWLVDLAARGGALRPRQALPDAAFLCLSEIQAATSTAPNEQHLPIVCVSHCWLQPDHPDPHAHNLRVLARVLKERVDNGSRLAVFIDFCSLHQCCRGADGVATPRAFPWLADEDRYSNSNAALRWLVREERAVGRFPQEEALFKQALSSLGQFFSHQKTEVYLLSVLPADYADPTRYERGTNVVPYSDRGWCFCESAWALMVKESSLVLDLGKDAHALTDYAALVKGAHSRGAPAVPAVFEALLAPKSFSLPATDERRVAELYRVAFELRLGATTSLVYTNLGWGNAETIALAEALRFAPALELLFLTGNAIGDEGARALAEVLPLMPALKMLALGRNVIGNAAKEELRAAWGRRGQLIF